MMRRIRLALLALVLCLTPYAVSGHQGMLLLGVGQGAASSGIAFDGATSGGGNGAAGATHTFSHTTTGANRYLVVKVMLTVVADTITGVTYNGVAMAFIGKHQNGTSGRWIYAYGLASPTVGANNVVITADSTQSIYADAASYTGVAAAGQPDASTTATTNAAGHITMTITTVASNCWTFMVLNGNDGSNPTSGAGTTLRAPESTAFFDSNGPKAAGSNSLIGGWATSSDTTGVMFSLVPA